MTSTTTLDAAAVLAAAGRFRADADAAEVGVLTQALEWARLHAVAVDATDLAATWGDTPVPIAGAGAPLVSEFCISEFAAALGVSTDSGRYLIAHALELEHRLPRLWARVRAGDLPVWRARRIAEKTISLTPEAAAYVDEQVAAFAHRVGPAQTDRLVAEATARHMPELADQVARQAADGRFFTIDHGQESFMGTSTVRGELDLADALDLAVAVQRGAEVLKDWGSEDTLDVRRSLAVGMIARGEDALDLPEDHNGTRNVTLYLHLDPRDSYGRLENTGTKLISKDQITRWLNVPGTQINVRPVLDLAEEITCPGYVPPARLVEQKTLTDTTCVFPFCTRPARRCDRDHAESFDPDGPPGQTSSSRLGSLCRRHHRLKTFTAWTYDVLDVGVYCWRSPLGRIYLRDRTGTRDLTPRPVDPPGG